MIKDDGNVIHFLNPKGTVRNKILDFNSVMSSYIYIPVISSRKKCHNF